MPLLKTFAEVKASRVLEVSGACADDSTFKSLVNEATDILMQRGDWPGTIVPIRVMVRNGCITWPRYVQRVRRINRCTVPLKVGTLWYDFVDRDNYALWCGQAYYSCRDESCFGTSCSTGTLAAQGRVPTYNDVPTTHNTQYIRAYCLSPLDVGKTVTIYGVDGNNQPLRHLNATTGEMEDGHVITLAIPYGSSSTYVQRIDAVTKEATRSRVPLYAYDATSDTLLDLAIYEPGETNPSYAKDRLSSCCDCTTQFTVIALVKLAFIPVEYDTDYVLIPSTNALKKAVQSIKYGESGEIEKQEAFMQASVNELNHVLNNENPFEQTSVNTGFMGESQGVGLQAVI